ncbi:hypothetical protein KVR01_004229 [Diaporthe batatas]|uniref:uncharacterized protein n=1 Tax=Diaporthe batatas TaxID=748121 RepID=UPI001D057940|nr:uncharacterized protein KVR01_004229 [Diaporthe batatas]KAG8165677.1 hypothetical protein KVR01_004229 [Diaporthe batatas]
MLTPRVDRTLLVLAAMMLLVQHSVADCECGYSAAVSNNSSTSTSPDTQQQHEEETFVFTDLIEANFANLSDVSKDTDWVRQEFNRSATQARGTYGQMFAVDNIETRDGHGGDGDGEGLQIVVRSDVVEGMLSGGEIDAARVDISCGSFRSSLRLTDAAGTVSAFFWYFNDTQEIDMEFLSKDFHTDNSSYPVHLVLQSQESANAGFDASGTPGHAVANLPFDPRADFHEYRFDFVPGRVVFYADGTVLAVLDDPASVPSPLSAGHVALSHWSNGNPLWSGGPPAKDAAMEVRYVKAYFNSTDEKRRDNAAGRCVDPAAEGAVCLIPAVTAGDHSAAGFFFTGQKNMSGDQIVADDNGVSGGDEDWGVGLAGLRSTLWMWVGLPLLVAVCL